MVLIIIIVIILIIIVAVEDTYVVSQYPSREMP